MKILLEFLNQLNNQGVLTIENDDTDLEKVIKETALELKGLLQDLNKVQAN